MIATISTREFIHNFSKLKEKLLLGRYEKIQIKDRKRKKVYNFSIEKSTKEKQKELFQTLKRKGQKNRVKSSDISLDLLSDIL